MFDYFSNEIQQGIDFSVLFDDACNYCLAPIECLKVMEALHENIFNFGHDIAEIGLDHDMQGVKDDLLEILPQQLAFNVEFGQFIVDEVLQCIHHLFSILYFIYPSNLVNHLF